MSDTVRSSEYNLQFEEEGGVDMSAISSFCRAAVEPPWSLRGASVEPPWSFRGASAELPWSFNGVGNGVEPPRSLRGASVELPRSLRGAPMAWGLASVTNNENSLLFHRAFATKT